MSDARVVGDISSVADGRAVLVRLCTDEGEADAIVSALPKAIYRSSKYPRTITAGGITLTLYVVVVRDKRAGIQLDLIPVELVQR